MQLFLSSKCHTNIIMLHMGDKVDIYKPNEIETKDTNIISR